MDAWNTIPVSQWPLGVIERKLAEDGYDPALAGDVKRAAGRASLLWTRTRLTTTDRSRIDVRPAR